MDRRTLLAGATAFATALTQRGGDGFMLPVRQDGVWQARRNIVPGRNIPGYPQR